MNILNINNGEFIVPCIRFLEDYNKNINALDISLTVYIPNLNGTENIEKIFFTDIKSISIIKDDKEIYHTDKYSSIFSIHYDSDTEENVVSLTFTVRVYKDGSHINIAESNRDFGIESAFEGNNEISSCTTLCTSNCVGVCTTLCTSNKVGVDDE